MKNYDEIADEYCSKKFGHSYSNSAYRGLVLYIHLKEISEIYAQQITSEVLDNLARKIDENKIAYIGVNKYARGYNVAINDCLEITIKIKNNEK